jgi:hypothetical protein
MAEYAQSQKGTSSNQAPESSTTSCSGSARQAGTQPAASVATFGLTTLVAVAGVSLAEMGVCDPGPVLLMPVARAIQSLLPREGKAHAKSD